MELVASMKNENSGVPAKLRTYVGPAQSRIGALCDPVNGGGVTVDLSSDTLAYNTKRTGYYVGGRMAEPHAIALRSRASAYGRALSAIYMAEDGEGFAGFWFDGFGAVIAEPVDWIEDRTEALSLAERRGEDAIYGIADSETIYL